MNSTEFQRHLERTDLDLGQKIEDLIKTGLATPMYLAMAEDLIEKATLEEAFLFSSQIMRLSKLIASKKHGKN